MPRTVWLTMAIVSALLAAPGSAAAATRAWIGGDGLWNDPTKWTGGVPMPGDSVFTGSEPSADITLSGTGANVGRVHGTGHLIVNGTTLTVTGDSDPPLFEPTNLSMSHIIGGGSLSVTGPGG